MGKILFFAALPCTRAKLTPNSRANLRTEGLACESLPVATTALSPTGTGVFAGAIVFGGSGAGLVGSGIEATGFSATTGATTAAGLAASSLTSMLKITPPCATLSPTLILISLTTPAKGDGMSIEALSDSTVIKESSLAILSPVFTKTSMTSTLSKLPISGTKTS